MAATETKVAQTGLANRIADAVARVPGVAGLTAPWADAATRTAGGRVDGVVLRHGAADVYIRAGALPLPPIATAAASAVKRVLREAGETRAVSVYIEELDEVVLALPVKEPADAHR